MLTPFDFTPLLLLFCPKHLFVWNVTCAVTASRSVMCPFGNSFNRGIPL